MEKHKKLFPKAHIWLLLPFVITLCGFSFTYWSRFSSVPFRHHIHGLSATAWYLLVIIQPYLYQKGNLRLHRRLGLLGLALAGGVVLSSLQSLPHNLSHPSMSKNVAYGLIFMDFVVVAGFSASVFLAIKHVKNTSIHGRWMISTVLWALQPAIIRLIGFSLNGITDGNSPLSFTQVVYLSNGLIFLSVGVIILLDYKREKVIYSSYATVCIAIVFMSSLYVYMTKAPWWGNFLENLLKH